MIASTGKCPHEGIRKLVYIKAHILLSNVGMSVGTIELKILETGWWSNWGRWSWWDNWGRGSKWGKEVE